jgi:predicted amidophosphoribosyltransferase
MKTGELDKAIRNHKYDGRWGWGIIFARVVLGYLPTWPLLPHIDLIIPMPAYLPPGTPRQGNDQAGWTLQSAIDQDDIDYPIRVDPPVIVKTAATEKMASTRSLGERQMIGAMVYHVLQVVDPSAVRGKVVAVYDDVFTSGTTLDAVARRLREAGASEVFGLTLARAPWR